MLTNGFDVFKQHYRYYQKQAALNKESKKVRHSPCSKELFSVKTNKDVWQKKYLDSRLLENLANPSKLIQEPIPNVLSFPFVNKQFCDEVIAEAEGLNTWGLLQEGYSHNDIRLRDLKLESIFINLYEEFVNPIAKNRWDYSFINCPLSNIVKYLPEKVDIKPYKFHHDMSAASILITLNDGFEGGGTYFKNYDYLHQPEAGWCTIFPGILTHCHRGTPITSGVRYIVVSLLY